MTYEMFIGAVASVLATLGILMIVLLTEEYLKVGRAFERRHPRQQGLRTKTLPSHRRNEE